MTTHDNDLPAPAIELDPTPQPEGEAPGPAPEEAEQAPAKEEAATTGTASKDHKKESLQAESEAAQVREAYDQFINNDSGNTDISLKTVLGGDILATHWFRRQLPFILFLSVLALFYVSNRYSCQQETIDKKKLVNRLDDRRKRAIVAECNLTEFCRRSNIQSLLRDTTLRMSNDAYYYIKVAHDSVPE